MSINNNGNISLTQPLVQLGSAETKVRVRSGKANRVSLQVADETGVEPVGTTKNQLGTYFGVIQPCLLNIFGAILFVRLPWSIGQWGFTSFMFYAEPVGLTPVHRGHQHERPVRGGGAYYMVSRSMGPEFGAAIGLCYYPAAATSVAFYIIAFAENMF